MLKIGDFSKLSRISIRMLRHYDELGLLTPKSIDDFTGYRYYGEEQLPIVGRITALKDMGFALATVAEILQNYDDPQALANYLRVKQTEIQAQEEETQRRLRLLVTAIKRLREDDTAMHYNVTLKTIPERYVASVRQVISAYDQEGMLWEMLMRETAPLNLQSADNYYGLAVFHDKAHKERDVDVEIQGSVKGNYKNTEHVVFKTEAAVEVASAIYQGSYAQLPAVNHAVATWVQDNGYEFHGAMFCIYHVGYAQTHNQDDFVTEVCYPVRKK